MDRSPDWLKQAERDYKLGEISAADEFHEWAAFAAQQSAEKATKALAQFLHGSARGHSITTILLHLSASVEVPSDIVDCARELDQVYVTARYPNGFVSGAPADYFTAKTSEHYSGMHRESLNFAEVRFVDRKKVLEDLHFAAREAMSRRPEILKVFLFGSLVRGNWTADSDADLIVVVRKEFSDIFERSRYQIYTKSISTDTLVYSETEFDQLCRNPSSILAQNLSVALELGLSAD